jgi:catechol 2,3-dioxygenase-like lactoylglutathione lyase family enzyme
MIHHVSIGVRSIATAKTFYDAALAPLGYACLRARDTWVGAGTLRLQDFLTRSGQPISYVGTTLQLLTVVRFP